jgi:group I intron endonuclease
VALRWGSNGCAYTKSQYFAKAIAKYGWKNIRHEILFTGLSKEEAEEKEIELIALHDLTNHANGYNISAGGGGTVGVKASEETRRKLSDSHKNGKRPRAIPVVCIDTGVVYSSMGEAAEKTGCTKSGIIDCLAGRKNTTHGMRFDYALEQHRKPKIAKMTRREASVRNGKLASAASSVPVLQYSKDGEFIAEYPSIKVATQAVGGSSNHISACTKGTRKTAFGYIWKAKARP